MATWHELERRLGHDDLTQFVERDVKPVIGELDTVTYVETQTKALKSLQISFTIAFFAFFISFSVLATSLPEAWWSIPLTFICFPLMFFGSLALAAWLRRDALVTVLLKAKANFIARSAALSKLAEKVGLTYVATPGGAPESLKVLARLKFMPKRFNELIEVLDAHGGQEEAVETAIESGLLAGDVVVLGNQEQKDRYYRQTAMGHSFEDGFTGERNGIRFSAFEWIETVDKAPDRYHLLIVFKPPVRLLGSTHLRSRNTRWPKLESEQPYGLVDLVPDTFNEYFRLRSTDQVEARTIFNPAVVERVLALAHGQPFRAVAQEEGLVFDFVGDNRFALIDLKTGEWNDETIKQSVTDVAELLELVDTLAHAFMVRD